MFWTFDFIQAYWHIFTPHFVDYEGIDVCQALMPKIHSSSEERVASCVANRTQAVEISNHGTSSKERVVLLYLTLSGKERDLQS